MREHVFMTGKFIIKSYRKNLLWRNGLYGMNGEQIMVSEAYFSEANAVREARKLVEKLTTPAGGKR